MSDLFPKNIVPLESPRQVRFRPGPPSEGFSLTPVEGLQPTNLMDVLPHPAQQGQGGAQSPSNDPATTSLSKAKRKKADKKKEKKTDPSIRRGRRDRSASATPQPIRMREAKSTEEPDVSIKQPPLLPDDSGSSGDEQIPPPIFQTKGTRFVGDPKYRDLVAERQQKAAETRELKKDLRAKMSRGQRVQAAMITGATTLLEVLINGPTQKETAKGNLYGVHGAMTDIRAGGLVGMQVPDAGPMSSVVYGGFGIGSAATATADIYFKTAAWAKYKKKLSQLEKDLGQKERALQMLILEKEAVDGSGEAQRALNEYRLQDQLRLAKKERQFQKQGKPWERPVTPERARDKYGPTPTPAQLKTALKVEIATATKARDAAKAALKTHANTLVKEWLKFLRDILAQSGTSATSTAWGLHTLSLVVDITVNIVDIALLPVMGGLSTVTGSVDQYDSRKDRNASQANFSKAMQKVLVATEALGHYEKVLQDLEHNGHVWGPAWKIALQNRNAAEVALRNANRVLRELIRKLNVADLRELKGRIYQSGGLAVLIGGLAAGPAGATLGLIWVGLGGSGWWGGVGAGVVFRAKGKLRAKARQLVVKDYVAENGAPRARELMQNGRATLEKKGNVVRQLVHAVSGGKIHALRDVQPLEESNLHLNEYVTAEVYAHDLLAGPGTPSYENAQQFLEREGLSADAFKAAMAVIDIAVERDKTAGTYVIAGHIELLKKLVASIISMTIYDPASLTNDAPIYKAQDLLGGDFLHQFGIRPDKVYRPGIKARIAHAATRVSEGIETAFGAEAHPARTFLQAEVRRKSDQLCRELPDKENISVAQSLEILEKEEGPQPQAQDFDDMEVRRIGDGLRARGYNFDDLEEVLTYITESCPEANQEVFYRQPEVQVLMRVITQRICDEIDQADYEAFAKMDKAKGIGTRLPKVHRAITDCALSINKFERDRKAAGLSHYLDCINVFCDLANAGISIQDVKDLKYSLEKAKGKNAKKRGARKPLEQACTVIEDFYRIHADLLSQPGAMLKKIKQEQGRTSVDALAPLSGLERKKQDWKVENVPWIVLARVERAINKEFRGRHLLDGNHADQWVVPLQGVRDRMSQQFFKQLPTENLDSFAAEVKWNRVRNLLALEGIAADDLLMTIGPLQQVLKTERDPAEYMAANVLLAHVMSAICPPVFVRNISEIVYAVAETAEEVDQALNEVAQRFLDAMSVLDPTIEHAAAKKQFLEETAKQLDPILERVSMLRRTSPAIRIILERLWDGEIDKARFLAGMTEQIGLTVEGASRLNSNMPVFKDLLDKLAKANIGKEQLLDILKSQDSLSEASRMPTALRKLLFMLLMISESSQETLSKLDKEVLDVKNDLVSIKLAKKLASLGEKVLWDRVKNAFAEVGVEFGDQDVADLKQGTLLTADLKRRGLDEGLADAVGKFMIIYFAPEDNRLAPSVRRQLIALAGQGFLAGISDDVLREAWKTLGVAEKDLWKVAMSFLDSELQLGPGSPTASPRDKGKPALAPVPSQSSVTKPSGSPPTTPTGVSVKDSRTMLLERKTTQARVRRFTYVNLEPVDPKFEDVSPRKSTLIKSDDTPLRQSTLIELEESKTSPGRKSSPKGDLDDSSSAEEKTGGSAPISPKDADEQSRLLTPEEAAERTQRSFNRAKQDLQRCLESLWNNRPSAQTLDKLHRKMVGVEPGPMTAADLIKIKSALPEIRNKVLTTLQELYPSINFRNKMRVGWEAGTVGSGYDNRLEQTLATGTNLDKKLAWASIVMDLQKKHKLTMTQIEAVFRDLAQSEQGSLTKFRRTKSSGAGKANLIKQPSEKLEKKSDYGRGAMSALLQIHLDVTQKLNDGEGTEQLRLNQFLRLREAIREGGKSVAKFNKAFSESNAGATATAESHRVWAALANGEPPMGLKEVEALIKWVGQQPSNWKFNRVHDAALNLVYQHYSALNLPKPPISFLLDIDAELSKLNASEELKTTIKPLRDVIHLAVEQGLIDNGDLTLNTDFSEDQRNGALEALWKELLPRNLTSVKLNAAIESLRIGILFEHPRADLQALEGMANSAKEMISQLIVPMERVAREKERESNIAKRIERLNSRAPQGGPRVSQFRRTPSSQPDTRQRSTSAGGGTQQTSLPNQGASAILAKPGAPLMRTAQPTQPAATISIANSPQPSTLVWNYDAQSRLWYGQHSVSHEWVQAHAIPEIDGYLHMAQVLKTGDHQCTLYTFNNMNWYLSGDMNCALTKGHLLQVGRDIGHVENEDYSVDQIIKVSQILNDGEHQFKFPTYEGATCFIQGGQLHVTTGIGDVSSVKTPEVLEADLANASCAGITFIFATPDSKEGAQHTVFIYKDKKTGVFKGMDSLSSQQIELQGADNLRSAIAQYVALRGNPTTVAPQVDIFFPAKTQHG